MYVGRRDLVDIFDPFAVRADVVGTLGGRVRRTDGAVREITYQADHLDAALLEFILHLGKCAQLGGADGREVGGVREQNGPTITNELMEVDLAFGGQSLEVGSFDWKSAGIHALGIDDAVPVDPRRKRGCSWAGAAKKRRKAG